MSAFPRMLEFRQKTVPHTKLLRWQEWFSKYSFTVQTIKRKDNVIADFLSRPQKQNPPLAFTVFDKSIPLLFMVSPIPVPFDVPPKAFRSPQRNYSYNMLFKYQSRIIQQHGDSCTLQPLGVHPKYLFSCLFSIDDLFHFSQEVLHFLWYFCDLYTIGIQFPLVSLYEALINHRC